MPLPFLPRSCCTKCPVAVTTDSIAHRPLDCPSTVGFDTPMTATTPATSWRRAGYYLMPVRRATAPCTRVTKRATR
jgi:hypothetical protein